MTKNEQEELGKTLWKIADKLRGAMNAGKGAMAKRAGRKSRLVEDPNAPPVGGEPKRKLKPGERKGDEVIYPTDNLTDQMQPRK